MPSVFATTNAASWRAWLGVLGLLAVSFAAPPLFAESSTHARPLGRMNFWFYSPDAAEAFVAGDHRGVTSVSYSGQSKPLVNRKIHDKGMAVLAGMGGVISVKKISAEELLHAGSAAYGLLNIFARDGADAIYVDEPVGPSLINECGADCYDAPHLQATAKGVEFIVTAMNKWGDYFRALVPGGKFGVCVGDGGGVAFHLMALRAGLREDFACFEEYGGAHYHPLDGVKKEFPSVKTMLLVYNTLALCSGNEIDAFDTWGFWNLDSHQAWIPGPRGDADWFENAKRFARGDTSFCLKPLSQVMKPITWDVQKRDFQVTADDGPMRRPPPFTLGKCEYRVVSNGRETVPWRARGCGQPFTVTVGAGRDCGDKGPLTCFVHVRAWTSKNEVGDAQYEKFNIDY